MWDYNIPDDELKKIACGTDMKKKQWLFNRIVYNSRDKISDLLLFSQTDLQTLFDDLDLFMNGQPFFYDEAKELIYKLKKYFTVINYGHRNRRRTYTIR